MSKWKKACIALAVILIVICGGLDAWWIIVKDFAPDKITDNTIYASNLQTTDGTKSNIFEVNYYSNANQNGYEMFELKINYLTDSTAQATYTQGLQFIANAQDDKIEWQLGNYLNITDLDLNHFPYDKYVFEEFMSHIVAPGGVGSAYQIGDGEYINVSTTHTTLAYFQRASINTTSTQTYEYSSSDNFTSSAMGATNPISDNTRFMIQLKDEEGNYVPYGLGFRGARIADEINNAQEQPLFTMGLGVLEQVFLWWNWGYANVYPLYDINYIAYNLYNAVKGMPAGTNQYDIVEFGDMFEYYTIDENNVFQPIRAVEDSSGKVKQDFTSYYGIKINVSADGAQQASRDSIFKMIKGSSGFNITDTSFDDSYFYGNAVVTASVYDLEFIPVAENKYAVKLNDAFMQKYDDYKETIQVSIEIDLDILKAKNIVFMGFANNPTGEFELFKCYTIETVDGQLVRTEVSYA